MGSRLSYFIAANQEENGPVFDKQEEGEERRTGFGSAFGREVTLGQ